MRTYELIPHDRKSFYGKAKVTIDDNGNETLYSYGTPIIERKSDGTLIKLWDGYDIATGKYIGYTNTTCRHIKAFCGLSKAQYEKL